MSIGNRIKELRQAKSLTQKQLADIINVSPQVISNWERSYTSPDHDDVARLAKALSVSADFLLGGIDEAMRKLEDKNLDELITEAGMSGLTFDLAWAMRMKSSLSKTNDLEKFINQDEICYKGKALTSAEKERLKDFIEIAMEIIHKDETEKSPEALMKLNHKEV